MTAQNALGGKVTSTNGIRDIHNFKTEGEKSEDIHHFAGAMGCVRGLPRGRDKLKVARALSSSPPHSLNSPLDGEGKRKVGGGRCGGRREKNLGP